MTRRTLSLFLVTATLALDPLFSITDAQDGDAGSAPGEAPRPDVQPRAALLTGDVVTDTPVGELLLRVEAGPDGHPRLVAKSQDGTARSALVEVHCLRAEGSLMSRMGPREEEVGVQRVRLEIPAGGTRTVALAVSTPPLPAPAAGPNDIAAMMRSHTWWQFRLQLIAAQPDAPGTYWPTVVLTEAAKS